MFNIVFYMVGDIETYRAVLRESDSEEEQVFESYNRQQVVYNTLAYLDESNTDNLRFRLSGRPFHSEDYIDILNFTHEYGVSRTVLIRILVTLIQFGEIPNSLLFDTTVTKCGNSLVVKITDQCRLMALEPGDSIRVKLERVNTIDSGEEISRLFSRKQTEDLRPYSMYADDEYREHFDRFVKDYHIVGSISLHGIQFDHTDLVIDHQSAVKTEDGIVILISIPYNDEGREEYARAFADAHDLQYDFVNQYSWYHRGDTQLIIFWPKGKDLRISHRGLSWSRTTMIRSQGIPSVTSSRKALV